MERKILSGIILSLLLLNMLTLAFKIQPANAGGTIYIRADGSIDPPTANITTADNFTYTFTGNVNDSIVVESDNIVVDGVGYTLQGIGSGTGIDLSYRNNVTIKNMEIKAFECGIYVYDSSNNTICGNNVTNNDNGVYLSYSSNNFLYDNLLDGNQYGFRVTGNELSHHLHSIDTSNLVDGKPVYYLISQHGITINPSTYPEIGFLALINSTNITVEDLTLTSRGQGLLLAYTNNSRITNNNLTNNYLGIYFYGSSNNSIFGNNITGNDNGVYLYQSSSNIISGNTITNCSSGVYLGSSSDNKFYHNNFIDNTQQVNIFTPGYANSWDNGYPSGGNYWSDHEFVDEFSGPCQNETGSDGIVDDFYEIDEDNMDTYPLMGPFGPLTIIGENVPVFPTDGFNLMFENVTTEGFTTVNKTETGPELPSGFRLAEQYYDIETTANYSGKIKIRIIYDDSDMTQQEEEGLQLMQWDETTQQWIDITTYVDTENNIIHGETSHLSMFAMMLPIVPVGGIYVPVNKLSLLAPYIGLAILLAVAAVTAVHVKKRKRKTEINS